MKIYCQMFSAFLFFSCMHLNAQINVPGDSLRKAVSPRVFPQMNYTPAIKAGININRFHSTEGYASIKIGNHPEFYYLFSYEAGLSWEMDLNEKLSFMPEIFYKRNVLAAEIYTGIETTVEQKLTNHYIRLPFLLKYKTERMFGAYIFTGLNTGFLLKSQYKYHEFIGWYTVSKGESDITDKMNVVNLSMDFGVGIPVKISDIAILFELRYTMGITKDTYRSYEYPLFDKWRTHSLQFILGLKIK